MLRFLTMLLVLCTFTYRSVASHLLGGEIGYEYVSTAGNVQTYRVTLSLFSDCSSTSAALPLLIGADPIVSLYNNNALVQSVNLSYQAALSDVEITPVCPDEVNNTACTNINNPIPGIKRYVYKGDFAVTGLSANWHFSFEGYISLGSSAGRTPIILNANVLAGSSLMYLKATLNNLNAPNSSCTFTSPPTPFFCVNKAQTYNLGAVDPNSDSLHFALVDAQQLTAPNAPPPVNITYYAPYTATAPLPAAPGNFTFNANNGQMDFTPNLVLNSVVVNRVEEYRNGIMVGSSMREMTFVILNNCNNNLPDDTTTNPGNATIIVENGSALVQTCQGQSGNLTFDIPASDPDGDNITLTATNLPAGATGTVAGNGTPNPVFTFSWNVSNTVSAGDYSFYLTFTDDGCPLASTRTVSKTVRILPFEGGLLSGSQAPCRADSNGFAFLVQSASDTTHYHIVWTNSTGDTMQTAYGNHGDTLFNLAPGVYNVVAFNSKGCSKFFNIGVQEAFYGIGINTPDTLNCVAEPFVFQNTSFGDLGAFVWDFGDGSAPTQQANPSHAYQASGTYTVTLSGVNPIGCRDTGSIQVYVDTIYIPGLLADRDSICIGDKIFFYPDGGPNTTGYTWSFGGDILQRDSDDTLRYAFDRAGTFSIDMQVFYRACPDRHVSRSVSVHPYPLVSLGPDSVMCLNSDAVVLQNVAANTDGPYRYSWSTGATTPSITISRPGTYSLTLASRFDCATTESIRIVKDCYVDVPNSFTPNGDGVNDYFFPRQLTASGISAFSMQVLNRWGQVIFETMSTNGRGWDGRFNGKEQPSGVYIYRIQATLANGRQEQYTGNVTLLR